MTTPRVAQVASQPGSTRGELSTVIHTRGISGFPSQADEANALGRGDLQFQPPVNPDCKATWATRVRQLRSNVSIDVLLIKTPKYVALKMDNGWDEAPLARGCGAGPYFVVIQAAGRTLMVLAHKAKHNLPIAPDLGDLRYELEKSYDRFSQKKSDYAYSFAKYIRRETPAFMSEYGFQICEFEDDEGVVACKPWPVRTWTGGVQVYDGPFSVVKITPESMRAIKQLRRRIKQHSLVLGALLFQCRSFLELALKCAVGIEPSTKVVECDRGRIVFNDRLESEAVGGSGFADDWNSIREVSTQMLSTCFSTAKRIEALTPRFATYSCSLNLYDEDIRLGEMICLDYLSDCPPGL